MNRIYRLVFNRELGVMQVASELASSPGGAGTGPVGRNARRSPLAAAVLGMCGLFGAASTAWAQNSPDYAAIFDDDYVMSPDTAANYDWSTIRNWGMIVGYENNGHLVIRDGLLVESSGFTLGFNEGVTGQLDVIGPNTTLTEGAFGDTSYVGLAGTGVFNVSEGGKAIFTNALEGALRLGWSASGVGTVNVDGEGSEVQARLTQVGHAGAGTLNITNSGKFSVGNFNNDGVAMSAADLEGATGTILVDGAGSQLEVFSSALLIGDGGKGALTISDGGLVTTIAEGLSSGVRVGYETSGEGSIDITGAGSTLNASSLVVGASGSGQVTVREGGRIEANREEPIGTWLSVGSNATGTGGLLIEGAGTTLDAKGSGAVIGYGGQGELTVRNGASASLSTIILGNEQGASGSVLVTGAGTRLTTGDDAGVYIGNRGNGDLKVLDGAEVSVGHLFVGASPTDDDEDQDPSGSALVSGEGTAMNVVGELVVADNQSGSLVVESGASVEAGSVRVERDEDGNSSDYAGELRITGAGTTFKSTGAFDVSAHFSLTGGARLDTGEASIRRNYATKPGEHAVISGAGTVWNNTGELFVDIATDITDGAKVSTGTLVTGPGAWANSGTPPTLIPQLRVLGEGSSLTTTGELLLGDGLLASDAPGYVVLADGGSLQAGGDIRLAQQGGLLFGAGMELGEDDVPVFAAPVAPGVVNQDARFVFTAESGDDKLVFNHTSDDLVLSNTMLSDGYTIGGITSVAGVTRLTGDMSQFTSQINVTGGKLVLESDVNARPADFDPATAEGYVQLIEVTGGELIVNSQLGYSFQNDGNHWGTTSVEVTDGGILGGNGTIAGFESAASSYQAVEIYNGGRVAPGDGDADTLTIDGDLTFGQSGYQGSAAFYDVDIKGDGRSDQLVVSGTAWLDEGEAATTVAVNALDPGTSYQNGQQYTILTASGGVEGTFDKVLSNSAFLTPTLSYDPNNVFLTVALNTSKADAVVKDGEVLSGNSDWASIEVQSGGTVSPGTSGERLGTISASGPITFAEGSFYDVDIRGTAAAQAAAAASGGDSDLLTTSGQATLNGGTVRVTALDPETSYQDGHTYTILTAEGGLSGTFEDALSRSAFLTPTLSYDDKNALLTIALKSGSGGGDDDDDDGNGDGDGDNGTPTTPPIFETVAITRNQYNIARALDTLPQSGDGLALYNKLLMLSAQEARDTYGSLSGESHLATRSALLDDRFLREGIVQRLSGEVTESANAGITAWVAGSASSGGIAGDFNASRTGYQQEGLMAGVDWALSDTLVLGAALGAADHATRVAAWDSDADIGARHLGVYAQARWAGLAVRGGISHAWYDVDSTRHAAAADTHVDRLDADYDASATTVFAEGGWDFALGGTVLTPYLALAHTRLETDAATEHGGITALDVAQSKDELLSATAGVRASWAVGGANADDARLQAGLAWQNNSGELKPDQRARFVAGGDAFSVYGTPLARNLAVANIGLSLRTSDASQLTMDVQGRFGDGQHDGGAQLQWSWRF